MVKIEFKTLLVIGQKFYHPLVLIKHNEYRELNNAVYQFYGNLNIFFFYIYIMLKCFVIERRCKKTKRVREEKFSTLLCIPWIKVT